MYHWGVVGSFFLLFRWVKSLEKAKKENAKWGGDEPWVRTTPWGCSKGLLCGDKLSGTVSTRRAASSAKSPRWRAGNELLVTDLSLPLVPYEYQVWEKSPMSETIWIYLGRFKLRFVVSEAACQSSILSITSYYINQYYVNIRGNTAIYRSFLAL